MHLKRLEINGFKSFAQKTVLDFEPGITGIVGPNGSGKSNTADAVRWVMGEQSAKNLRTKKSHDVIFTGSDKKAQLSLASVSLHLDNKDHRLPLEYDEVVISRKVYRSGETEYLINKSKARLLDIVDILARGGVGQRSYVVISQGMADAVLKASPQELRSIFEDASGVKTYQLKKNDSLRKLSRTEENLVRVYDLLNEIAPRLKNLKRLAKKALEKGTVEKDLRALQQRWYKYSFGKLNADSVKFAGQTGKIKENIGILQKEVDEAKASLGDFYKKRGEDTFQEKVQEEIYILEGKRNELYKKLAQASGNIEIQKEKIKMRDVAKTVPVNLAYVRETVDSLVGDYNKIAAEIKKLLSDYALKPLDNNAALQIESNLKVLGDRILKMHDDVKRGNVIVASKEDDLEMKKEIEAHKNLISEIEKSISGMDAELKKIDAEILAKRQSIRQHAEEKREKEKDFFIKEREWREKETRMLSLKDSLRDIEIEKTKVDTRSEDLAKEIILELGEDPFNALKAELNAGGTIENLSLFDEQNLRSDVQKYKYKLAEVGSIDPLVVKEYEETNTRYEFLTGQTEDLKKAGESLRAVITELDIQIVIQFNEAFKKINEEFDKYFKIIFGGGNASLTKSTQIKTETGGAVIVEDESEEENYIKVDTIEIKANPPGKRVKDIALLSGGERALTSVALLFAIISNNPPPFVILDEIDAALDEANSGRFGRILQELADKTQFIIITHNRETMRQAKALYGVTMGDDSVSRVLSIKLEKLDQNAKAS